jgi:hypothetical protein
MQFFHCKPDFPFLGELSTTSALILARRQTKLQAGLPHAGDEESPGFSGQVFDVDFIRAPMVVQKGKGGY